jgi:hypothetical protein
MNCRENEEPGSATCIDPNGDDSRSLVKLMHDKAPVRWRGFASFSSARIPQHFHPFQTFRLGRHQFLDLQLERGVFSRKPSVLPAELFGVGWRVSGGNGSR